MPNPVEVLDRIARSDTAVFAFDANDLIILWNRACEKLLGRPAYKVLGRRCFDVMCGRDVFGNLYCCPSCPVSLQARERPDQPVRRFVLDVATGNGSRRVAISIFAIRSSQPSLATLVHVLHPPDEDVPPLEAELEQAVVAMPPRRRPSLKEAARPFELTDREKEVLRKMSHGIPTREIAEQLFISPVTVRNHVARILGKLDVHTKLAAVALAYRTGLLPPESAPLSTKPLDARRVR
jgi:DNA-binding CsgD family transcriptional regulator